MVRVEFRVDGNLVNTDTTAPYAFTATGLAAGSHSVTATAVDNGSPALSTTSTAVAFSIGTTAAILPPWSRSRVRRPDQFRRGRDRVRWRRPPLIRRRGVARCEFRVDGTLVCNDTSAPYSFNATGLATGSHSVVVTCFDNGNPA